MIKIGITGGIGSGKSILSRYFIYRNIPVYDTDSQAKRLMVGHPDLKIALTGLLGREAYQDGQLNKAYISSCIFQDKSLLRKVNALVHPVVKADFIRWSKEQHSSVVAMECAILFEADFSSAVDFVIQVSASEELRILRAMKRDGLKASQIEARMQNQMSDTERAVLADFEMINDNQHAIIPQIEAILKMIS
ncbi:MAG: dephospho-CoA kinase [Bacteroidales bacterium]